MLCCYNGRRLQDRPPGSNTQSKKLTLDNKPVDIAAKFKPLFDPRSVAFLGASSDPRKWGFRILFNLINGGFPGRIYPVNPKQEEILGLRVYKNVGDIPEIPDLAVIVVPPQSVPHVVKECVDKGMKAGVVVTAGFAEVGEAGEKLQRETVEIARSGGMILVGPNSFGIVNAPGKLYSQMPPIFPPPGPIALISQSGNVVGTVGRLAMTKGFGSSKGISSGNEADLHSEDYLEYLGDDPQTKVILSYIEGFKDGSRFFQTAKEVSKKKPIVMLKAGETLAGARAAKSHTASLAGSDPMTEALCKQAGIIRVRSLDELVDAGLAFLCHPLPQGRRVGIVTAGGGWGVLAADSCAKLGLEVVSLPEQTLAELDSLLPAWWNRGNPVDLVAGAFGDAMIKCVEALLRCPAVDGVIMLMIMPALPQELFARTSAEHNREEGRNALLAAIIGIFDRLAKLASTHQKPVIVGSELPFGSAGLTADITRALGQMNSVCYDMPHQAVAAFATLAQYSEYLRQDRA